ncbi:hypothetical protein Nmel_007971, partial [Mimus melanotis]
MKPKTLLIARQTSCQERLITAVLNALHSLHWKWCPESSQYTSDLLRKTQCYTMEEFRVVMGVYDLP